MARLGEQILSASPTVREDGHMAQTAEQLIQTSRLRRGLPAPDARRAIRMAAGLSAQDVAESLGVSRAAISYWEAGKRAPKPPHLDNYARLLRSLAREIGS